MRNLTSEDKFQLRKKAKMEIERMEKFFNDIETLRLLDLFKNMFNICESAYKVTLLEHQKAKGRTMPVEKLKITMTQVPFALNFAGYTFDANLLNELFGLKSKINSCKTVKILRDSITHGINDKCVDEIKKRKEELFGYMHNFLKTIKTFDNENNIK